MSFFLLRRCVFSIFDKRGRNIQAGHPKDKEKTETAELLYGSLANLGFIYLIFGTRLFVKSYVSEVKHHIYSDHNKVQTVEKQNVPLRAYLGKIRLV